MSLRGDTTHCNWFRACAVNRTLHVALFELPIGNSNYTRNHDMSKLLSVLIAATFATTTGLASAAATDAPKTTPATPATPAKGDAAKATPATS